MARRPRIAGDAVFLQPEGLVAEARWASARDVVAVRGARLQDAYVRAAAGNALADHAWIMWDQLSAHSIAITAIRKLLPLRKVVAEAEALSDGAVALAGAAVIAEGVSRTGFCDDFPHRGSDAGDLESFRDDQLRMVPADLVFGFGPGSICREGHGRKRGVSGRGCRKSCS